VDAATILLVEDEETLAAAIRFRLRGEGFRVLWAADGAAALATFRQERLDLVLLDLMLPGIDGLEVCQVIRQSSTIPVMMLTARGTEPDKVRGLELGADDYLVKPFGMAELIARIRALLRRSTLLDADPEPSPVVVGPITVDEQQRRVYRDGRLVELRPREFDLLAFMARHPQQVFPRTALLENGGGYDFEGDPRTVDVHMRMLREKLETEPSRPVLDVRLQ